MKLAQDILDELARRMGFEVLDDLDADIHAEILTDIVQVIECQPRYGVIADGDGHEYLVPLTQVDEFSAWLDREDGTEPFERIEGRLTFAFPRIQS